MISIDKENYKLLKKIKDPKFSIDNLENYSLSVQLGVRDLQVFIFDNKNKRPLLLEDYIFDQQENEEARLEVIKDIFNNHHLLLAGFWKNVTILFKNRKFSLVPEKFFQKEHAYQFLELNAQLDRSRESIISIHHKKAAFVNVFAVNKIFMDFVNNTYVNKRVKFLHQSSAIINGALKSHKNGNFCLYIDRFLIHIVYVSNGELTYYNQFPIKKMEDYIRYLKLVADELTLDLGQTEVVLYGFMGRNTPQMKYLQQNISDLRIGERPKGMTYGYVFDEVPDHQFFELYSLHSTPA